MKKLLLILVVFTSFSSMSAFALKVTALYQVNLSISSQTEEIKQQAIKDAFVLVLQRVSGDPDILKNTLIRSNIKRADYYVQDYFFASPSTDASHYMLNIRFEPNDIKRLLKKAGVKIWGDNRPLLLVWLAVTDKENNTTIIDSESASGTYNTLMKLSNQVGLPLLFPMMDMTDLNQVSPDDVVNMTTPTLSAAGQRYAPDGLLLGRIKETDNDFTGDWVLIVGREQWKWTLTQPTMPTLGAALVNQVSQTLAKTYATQDINEQLALLKVKVSNIMYGDDVVELMQYLKQLALVEHVNLSEIKDDNVKLAVRVHGDLEDFQKHVNLDHKLLFLSEAAPQSEINYQWVR